MSLLIAESHYLKSHGGVICCHCFVQHKQTSLQYGCFAQSLCKNGWRDFIWRGVELGEGQKLILPYKIRQSCHSVGQEPRENTGLVTG